MKSDRSLGGLTGDRIWLSKTENQKLGPRCLFLDRDGVLIEDRGYVRRPEDVQLVPGTVDLLRWAQTVRLAIVVVTNQSGIDRKLFDWSAYQRVEAEIDRQLQLEDLAIDLTVACPFHPDFTPGYGAAHDSWRKPGPGMLQLAAQRLEIDLSGSWFVGDKWSDVGAARAAGLAGAVYIERGETKLAQQATSGRLFQLNRARSIREAHRILAEYLN